MNKKIFQFFVERFDSIEEGKVSLALAKAINLICLKYDNPESTDEYNRLMFIKNNTTAHLKIPLYILDSYVNPTKEAVNVAIFSVQQEFRQNDDHVILLYAGEILESLFEAYVEINVIVSKMIRNERWAMSGSMESSVAVQYPKLI